MNYRSVFRVLAALALLAAYDNRSTGWAASEPDDQSQPRSSRLGLCDGSFDKPSCINPGASESLRDCPDCPEMVVVPPGSFMMGSTGNEPDPFSGEGPLHRVTIVKPFAIGKFAVTFAEWDACVTDGGCGGYTPSDEGWGSADRPVINVSWKDAEAYADWLSRKTGQRYRLLSEAEYEYAARAGTGTLFWWGDSISTAQANYHGEFTYAGGPMGIYRHKTLPVRSFEPNPWGLYQVHGNVATWTTDCWVDNYNDAPVDGSARTTGNCKFRVLRGGSWYDYPQSLRVAVRLIMEPRLRKNYVGFRLARELCSAASHPRNALYKRIPRAISRC